MPDPLLDSLNPDQHAAVVHQRGPLLVLAGAGSGKTRVIVHRIAYLIERVGCHPRSILAMTFTNKAAGEMRERLAKLLGRTAGDVWVSTFHSTGAALLRREAEALGLSRAFTIYDDDDQISLAKRILREANREADAAGARDLLSAIDRIKNGVADQSSEEVRDLARRYQTALRAANAVDFGDLLSLPVQLFEEHPDILQRYRQRFEQLLVDEFQDTNQIQYRLLKLLCPPPGNLCVVGDDDQSIYRWRGADVGNILGFERDYPTAAVVRLVQNYRSDGNILAAATAVITKNPHRHPKQLWTERGAGEKIHVRWAHDERDEAHRIATVLEDLHRDGIPYGEMAIFHRINAQSRVIEEGLRLARIPYVIVRGRSFYERAEVKDAIAYLRLMVNPRSDVDLLRALNSPPRGLGDTTVERLSRHASAKAISLYDALRENELEAIPQLHAGTRARLTKFRALLDSLSEVARHGSAGEATQAALKSSGLLDRFAQQGTEEATERAENLMELVSAAREADERVALAGGSTVDSDGIPALQLFLEQVALLGEADGPNGGERVSVMTLHAAKGLEFDAVVIAGMEEGVFPHGRALNPLAAPEEMHEERRLCYVGFTRARHRLFLSGARSRALFGEVRFQPPSRFLQDVPPELLEETPWQDLESPAQTQRSGLHVDRSYDQTYEQRSWKPSPAYGSSYGSSHFRREGRHPRPGRSIAEFTASRRTAVVVIESQDWPQNVEVRHATFGVGRIVAAEGEGPEAKLTIRFRSVGDKRVIARFVNRI